MKVERSTFSNLVSSIASRKSKILLNLFESLASRTERQYRICERHPAGFADNDRGKNRTI